MADENQNLAQDMENLRSSVQGLGQTTDTASRELLDSFKQLGGTIANTASALKNGQTGATVFNDAVGATANVISTVLTVRFGLLGVAVGQLVKGLASYVKAVNKLSDDLLLGYQGLAKFGAATAEGSQGIYDLAQQLGYGSEELDKLTNIISQNSEALAILGGTAAQGVKAFGDITQGIQRTGLVREFANLGMSFEDINSNIAFYLRVQSQTGQAQKKTTAELTQGSVEYLRQLDILTKITGKNAETLQNEERERQADQQFRAIQRKLQIQANAGDAQAAKKLEQTRILLSQLGPEGRKAVVQAMTGFVGAGKEGEKLFRTSNRAFTALNQPAFEASDVLTKLAEDGERNADMFGGSLAALGEYNNLFLDFAQTLDLAAKGSGESFATQQQNAEQQQALQRQALNAATQNAIDINLANRDTKFALQNFTEKGLGPVTSAMSGLASVTRLVTKTFVPFTQGRVGTQQAPTTSGPEAPTQPQAKPVTPPATTPVTPPATKPASAAPTGRAPTQPQAKPASAAPTGRVSANPGATILGVLSAGPGFTTVKTDEGNQRREGARNWRNNNPGNIEYSRFATKFGAVGSDGRFAVFPTLDQGSQAKKQLLFGSNSNYVNLSIRDAIARYAPKTENATESYIRRVAAAAGVPDSTIMAQLSTSQRKSVLDALNQVEGFKPGKVTAAAYGGIIQSKPGGTLLQAAEAGLNEAYVPLPNGRSIPVEMPELKTQVDMMGIQISKLDELISVMRTNNNITGKILQVSRA